MGLVRSIKKLFAAPAHITRFDDLDPGEVIVDGEIRASDGEPLLSPIKLQPCVAFDYHASHRTPGRNTGVQQRPLRHAEGFRAFELELDGGRIDAVPRVPGDFGREDHQKLESAGYADFRAVEETVPTRARVRVRGALKRKGDRWVLTYRCLEILKPEPGAKKPGKKKR